MPEYTDLSCHSPETAEAVLRYLNEQINEQDDPPFITAYVHKSTLRITYRNEDRRREWDMQLMGFRDGRESVAQAVANERERCAKIADSHSATDCDGPDCGNVIASAIRNLDVGGPVASEKDS